MVRGWLRLGGGAANEKLSLSVCKLRPRLLVASNVEDVFCSVLP